MKMNEVGVVLDPGHGPNTPGKRTPYIDSLGKSIHEYEFNSAVVNRVMKFFRYRPMFIANTDRYFSTDEPLETRVKFANAVLKNYDYDHCIFISVHYNAMTNKFEGSKGSGLEVYHHHGSDRGKRLATVIYENIREMQPWQKPRGVKASNFYVIKYTDMPAALIEFGFMDDPYESALMIEDRFLDECAYAIISSIYEYFNFEDEDLPELWEMILRINTKSPDLWIAEIEEAEGMLKYLPELIYKLRGDNNE